MVPGVCGTMSGPHFFVDKFFAGSFHLLIFTSQSEGDRCQHVCTKHAGRKLIRPERAKKATLGPMPRACKIAKKYIAQLRLGEGQKVTQCEDKITGKADLTCGSLAARHLGRSLGEFGLLGGGVVSCIYVVLITWS